MHGRAGNCFTDYLTQQHTHTMIMIFNDDDREVEVRATTIIPLAFISCGLARNPRHRNAPGQGYPTRS
jgi:hypothetical protein